MHESWSAEYMDGRSAAVRPVRVVLDIGALKLLGEDEARPVVWPLRGLRIEDVGQGRYHLTHDSEPDAMLTSAEGALVHAIERQRGRGPRGASGWGQRAVLYGAGSAAAIAALYLATPALSRFVARRIPISVEEKIGLQIAPMLERERCRSPEADRALDGLVKRLRSGRPAVNDVWILDAAMVNAFALPGGRVVLTKGLIAEAAGPDEVAGVLAHELAHVDERHVMTQIVRGSVMSYLWALSIGDFSGLLVVDPSVAYQLATLGFSRDAEREADRGGVAMLDAARISRAGLASFFERLQAKTDGVPKLLSTHPASAERAATIKGGATSGSAQETTPALDADAWAALRNACDDRK